MCDVTHSTCDIPTAFHTHAGATCLSLSCSDTHTHQDAPIHVFVVDVVKAVSLWSGKYTIREQLRTKVQCCSVLQCVAVRCSVLQCVAVFCCSLLQFVAVCFSCYSKYQIRKQCRTSEWSVVCLQTKVSSCHKVSSRRVVTKTFSRVVTTTFSRVVTETFSRVVTKTFRRVVAKTFSRVVTESGKGYLTDIGNSGLYSLLHLECLLISICNLNLLGLFSTERDKRDLEN